MISNELRAKTLLVLDRQIAAICKDIVEDGCLSHNNSGLIVPIYNLISLLAVFDIDDEPGGDGDDASG
jgi:hypothetical protein